MSEKPGIEARFERGLFASRWLMAPMYLGLVISLAMMAVLFVKELAYYLPKTLTMTADQGILAVLTLIDLSLAANLLLIVIFSGYENFVSRFDEAEDQVSFLGKLDSGSLKIKVASSIVAISSIHLLQVFLNSSQFTDGKIMWLTLMHIAFVVSALMLGFLEMMMKKAKETGTDKG